MFYIAKKSYVGQNQDQYIDAARVLIKSTPEKKNSSGEVCTSGWCGTTSDWCVVAGGEYPTEEEARRAVTDLYGECREEDDIPQYDVNEGVIAAYRIGRYEPVCKESIIMYVYDDMLNDITAETTDEELDRLAEKYESAANGDGITLRHGLMGVLVDRLQVVLDDADDKGCT